MEETGLSSWKVFGEQTVVLRCESSNAKQQKKKTDIETVGAVFLCWTVTLIVLANVVRLYLG